MQSNYIVVFVYIYKRNIMSSNPVKDSDKGNDESTYRNKALPIYWENSQYLKPPLLICISDDLLYPSHFAERCNKNTFCFSSFTIRYILSNPGLSWSTMLLVSVLLYAIQHFSVMVESYLWNMVHQTSL